MFVYEKNFCFNRVQPIFVIGTSACPNGKFTCKNLGHKALVLQSSRVNDGVCGIEFVLF